MCWRKENVRASCEAVRGDGGGANPQGGVCVMCEKKPHNGRIAVLVEKGLCENGIWKY